ncbi:acyl-CoA dehydrogenase family protein [Piscinibacter gummiphilus]|uniref:Acyl-CoA dehydrogenase family protein n=1 Tax=Piscinibacter gummiphilus TaxID=946333 RepID=A0ABZ0CVE9_9BURK|nr:acyl-CoA dehydrogenase family protein [Piscinibacter gummiphilus]WOB08858.1 acyl-CoA dehydrogenase family protein [Piscinibacter gummiphilus]
MWQYHPPLRDIRFVTEELLNLPAQWAQIPAFAEVDADTARQVIEEAGKFASEVLGPLNAVGDVEGCTLKDGIVTTPKGFREAYQAFVQAGWPALACEPEVGGQGLPQSLNAVLHEMLNSANHAWNMYPGLLHGAYESLLAHATPELKARYLPKVVSGEWLSTMCLTEAHAGSDLGLLKTRAEPQPDGSYRVSGTKIFISGGEHDLTDNIVHMVLARIAGAPAGTKGLSLFLVPKVMPDGSRNTLRCDGLEKKMGIKGSATCVMSFEGATGWLVGDVNRGLAGMFVMMNAARLHVGLQGVGHAESAYQNALAYALERVQMRAPLRSPERKVAEADPIALHPAVRHNLLRQRALLEGGRLLAYETAHLLDIAERHPDEAVRHVAHDEVSLLTPICKAFLTDNGFAAAQAAQQVYGGHGYIHDYGVEQCVRDSRISRIYEGTNEIQAIDLLVRKVVADGGVKLAGLIERLQRELPTGELAARVQPWLANWQQATQQLLKHSASDAELPYRVADDYLRLAGLVLLAQGWARAEAVAASHATPFHTAKRETAQYYLDYLLPEAGLCLARIRAGQNPLPQLSAPSA